MASKNPDGIVRLGMLALPLAGLLASGGILATGDNRAIVSTGYFVSVLFGNVLALTVLIFGVVALYAYLANGGQRILALGAMASSIIGIALVERKRHVPGERVPERSRRPCLSVVVTLHDRQYHHRQPW